MEKMPLVKPSRCEHNNIAGYCHFCEELAALREENARLKAEADDQFLRQQEVIGRVTRERDEARAKLAKVVEAGGHLRGFAAGTDLGKAYIASWDAAEVAACDGHAYLRDEIKRLEGLILKVWEQSESDDDALRQLGPEACRIRGEAK